MGKGMSLGLINMYTDMVDRKFEPIISALAARMESIKPAITRQVKKDLGVYDLMAKKAALEVQVSEINDQIKSMLGTRYRYHAPSDDAVDREVQRRLDELNAPLTEAQSLRDSIKDTIKLSGSTPEVAQVFDALTAKISSLAITVKKLPPITELVQIDDDLPEDEE